MGAIDISKLKAIQNTVSDQKRAEWNGFIDFLKQKGMSGNTVLDKRDTNLGKQLMDEYRSKNPNISLNYDDVPIVQRFLNKYRQDAWNKVQAGKATATVDNLDDFMPNLSPVDGWLGSKTSQASFPHRIINGKIVGFANVND